MKLDRFMAQALHVSCLQRKTIPAWQPEKLSARYAQEFKRKQNPEQKHGWKINQVSKIYSQATKPERTQTTPGNIFPPYFRTRNCNTHGVLVSYKCQRNYKVCDRERNFL